MNCAENLILVEAALQPSFCQIVMVLCGINRAESGARCTPKVHLSTVPILNTMLTLPSVHPIEFIGQGEAGFVPPQV